MIGLWLLESWGLVCAALTTTGMGHTTWFPVVEDFRRAPTAMRAWSRLLGSKRWPTQSNACCPFPKFVEFWLFLMIFHDFCSWLAGWLYTSCLISRWPSPDRPAKFPGGDQFVSSDVLCQLESVRKLFSFPSEDPRQKAAKPRFFGGISVGSSGVLEQVLLIGTTPTISPFSLLWPGCWPGSWSLSIEIFLASNVKTGVCICLKLMSRWAYRKAAESTKRRMKNLFSSKVSFFLHRPCDFLMHLTIS